MDNEDLKPDPCDWKIIQCSNFLQILSCVCDIVSMFVPELRDLADLIDCIADLFTCSMMGCMGAQLSAQIKQHRAGGGAPALALEDENTPKIECVAQAEKIESVAQAEKIERS